MAQQVEENWNPVAGWLELLLAAAGTARLAIELLLTPAEARSFCCTDPRNTELQSPALSTSNFGIPWIFIHYHCHPPLRGQNIPLLNSPSARRTVPFTMRQDIRNTVERLDRPSAYYNSRVSLASSRLAHSHSLTHPQNKRRRDRDDDEHMESAHEPQADPLANATTLYVGNLYDTFPQPNT